MAAKADDNPSEFLRHNQDELMRVIMSAGIHNVADRCEQLDLIGADVKERVTNEASGKLEKDRASMILTAVKASFIRVKDNPGLDVATLDKFLCVLLNKSSGNVRQSLQHIVSHFTGSLPEFNKLVKKCEVMPLNEDDSMEISPTLATIHPGQELTVGSLYDALADLNKWDQFGRKLPKIRHADVERIQMENKEDIYAQKTALFDKWLRVDPDASWSTVVQALTAANENKLARQIAVQLGLSGRQSITSTERPLLVKVPSPTSSTDAKITVPKDTPIPEKPDYTLDSMKILDKVPQCRDVLEALSRADINLKEFREVLKVPAEGLSAEEAIKKWIDEEPSDVTWRTLCKGLKESNRKGIARQLINDYLKRPSVYGRYIETQNFTPMDV